MESRFESVVQMMEFACQKYELNQAFCNYSNELSYGDVQKYSLQFSAWLQSIGVQKGDRVAVMLPNILSFPIAMLGILRAGAIQVNVNPMYTPTELKHQLTDSGATVIVLFSGATPALADIVEQTSIQHIVVSNTGDCGANELPTPTPTVDRRLEGYHWFENVLDKGTSLAFDPVTLGADDLAFLQYTGGTTGVAKGAGLSHGNVLANLDQVGDLLESNMSPGKETIVTALPLYHIFALAINLLQYFQHGAKNYLVTNPRDLDNLVGVLKISEFTAFTGVNTLFNGLLLHPQISEVDFSHCKISLGGGTAILRETSSKWKAVTGKNIVQGYGISETSPVVSMTALDQPDFLNNVGLPLTGTEVRLVDDALQDVELGQPGEILVRGPQVMQGYWQKPEVNAEAITKDGFFRTGDVGRFTEQGYLEIVDRIKDMVLVSGFNVYPNEIESVASQCPGVAECACIGVPDATTGEALQLFAVAIAGSGVTKQQITDHCRGMLTPYKVPKKIDFVDQLPKSAVGKILRRELRETTFG